MSAARSQMPIPFRPFVQKIFGVPPGPSFARVRSGGFVVAVGLVAFFGRLESASASLNYETLAEIFR